jgi:hypothetical protein
VTLEQYLALLAANSQQGKTIVIQDGAVVAIDPPAPSPEGILQMNTAARAQLLSIAADSIAPLQDAVDLGVATAGETASLTAWKQYRVAVSRVDMTQAAPAWPSAPEA